MSYVGKWVFHSIGMVNDSDEMVFLSAEEYLKAPMPYIDESDEEAVADELKERLNMIGGQIAVCEDGWAKLSDDDGHLLFMTTRYTKAD